MADNSYIDRIVNFFVDNEGEYQVSYIKFNTKVLDHKNVYINILF